MKTREAYEQSQIDLESLKKEISDLQFRLDETNQQWYESPLLQPSLVATRCIRNLIFFFFCAGVDSLLRPKNQTLFLNRPKFT